jgi:hypothetical protein
MKTQRILYIVAGILGLITVLLIFSNPWETLDKKGENLALKNPENVTSALLTWNSDTIELTKIKNRWEVNHHFSARPRSINLLLHILEDVEIKSPVSRKNHDAVLKRLHAGGKQLIVFNDSKKLKTYLIATDSVSTYMMLEGSKTPYRVELRGYSGVNMYELLPVRLDFWRNNVLFNFNPAEIASVEVIYPGRPDDSYKISRNDKAYRLFRWNNDKELKDADDMTILDYLGFFSKVEFDLPSDSLRQKALAVTESNDPIFMMTVITIEGVENTVKAYRMPVGGKSDSGRYNTDNFYALINNDSELVIMNYTDFDPLLKSVNYFLKK